MNLSKLLSFTLIVFGMLTILFSQQKYELANRNWKGNAILGNGNFCAVYSDDARITSQSSGKGIQHFYFLDYTVDYIASTEVLLYDDNGNLVESNNDSVSIGMKNFFTTSTKTFLKNQAVKEINCFALKEDVIVLSFAISNYERPVNFNLKINLRKNFISNRTTSISEIKAIRELAYSCYQNKVCLGFSSTKKNHSFSVEDSIIFISGKIKPNEPVDFIIAADTSYNSLFTSIKKLKDKKNLFAQANKFWNEWMNTCPSLLLKSEKEKIYFDLFKRNLYAAKSACLNGQIPADITGQFVTNNMPQLYPRDAMMVARVFLLTQHFKEAKQVIDFWKRKNIPKKSKGEFFARYDAYANAVDAGSGARFDEPEWDANGYFIQLVFEYYKIKKIWLADKNFIYELANFLVENIDKNNLLYEGGIVEWTGFLPSTNMICAASLETASKIAAINKNKAEEIKFINASKKISSSLIKMFDKNKNTYTSVRFYDYKGEQNKSLTKPTKDTVYLWDTSTLFGFVWGFPNHRELELSYKFYYKNTLKQFGGMQYFDSQNPGLASYGHDLFFFTTAAAANYQIAMNNKDNAAKHIDWMMNNSNIYGLMPERIYLNESDCSPASPLSWCCAEFAGCVLKYLQTFTVK